MIGDNAPAAQIDNIARQAEFKQSAFSALILQMSTPQSPVHHPEGHVWNHTLLVVDRAAARKTFSAFPRAFMWAALLHDIGKPDTTKNRRGRITAYDHDRVGADLARAILQQVTDETNFLEAVVSLVRYHMQPLYVVKGLPFQDIDGMKSHTSVAEVALLSYCDRLGRGSVDRRAEAQAIITFLKKCNERTDFAWLRQV
ncbi:MAG: hypothetical protein K0S22_305 [Oscillospiraceae bacterium]|nr:hypothetical protein [Oscillospiraceae bacterium]